MTTQCTITDADYRAFRRHVLFRYRKIHVLYGCMFAAMLLLTWFGAKPEESTGQKIFGLAVATGWFYGLKLSPAPARRSHSQLRLPGAFCVAPVLQPIAVTRGPSRASLITSK